VKKDDFSLNFYDMKKKKLYLCAQIERLNTQRSSKLTKYSSLNAKR